jgi:hypothetical protein
MIKKLYRTCKLFFLVILVFTILRKPSATDESEEFRLLSAIPKNEPTQLISSSIKEKAGYKMKKIYQSPKLSV